MYLFSLCHKCTFVNFYGITSHITWFHYLFIGLFLLSDFPVLLKDLMTEHLEEVQYLGGSQGWDPVNKKECLLRMAET